MVNLDYKKMRILLLMRHAKASPSKAGLGDIDRPLLDEGRNAAERVGKFLKSEKLAIDLALSSTAVRARETLEAVLQGAAVSLTIRTDQRLYDGGPSRLLEVLSEIDDNLKTILLVGHNPVLEDLVSELTGQNAQLAPATLTIITLDLSEWIEVVGAKARLDRVVRAADLPGS